MTKPAAGGSPGRNALSVAVEIAVNIALPFAVFSLARGRLGDANALTVSSAPPIAWSILEFARKRRIDALSMLVLTGIVLSLLAFFGGGGIRMLQLREKLVTGLVGLIFLGSAAVGRPLIYDLARATLRRSDPAKAAALATLKDSAGFRGAMLTMTLAWGVALVAECAVAVGLTYLLPPKTFMLVGPVLGYGSIGAMVAWTYAFARRRIGPQMRAALEAVGD
jgi:hypothetical protein